MFKVAIGAYAKHRDDQVNFCEGCRERRTSLAHDNSPEEASLKSASGKSVNLRSPSLGSQSLRSAKIGKPFDNELVPVDSVQMPLMFFDICVRPL